MYSYDRRTAAASVKVDQNMIREINADLRKAGLDGNGRFRSVGHAHSAAGNVLEKHGFEFTDVLSSYLVKLPSKFLTLDISKSNPDDPFSPVQVSNTALAFSYTKLDENRVEVIAYLG